MCSAHHTNIRSASLIARINPHSRPCQAVFTNCYINPRVTSNVWARHSWCNEVIAAVAANICISHQIREVSVLFTHQCLDLEDSLTINDYQLPAQLAGVRSNLALATIQTLYCARTSIASKQVQCHPLFGPLSHWHVFSTLTTMSFIWPLPCFHCQSFSISYWCTRKGRYRIGSAGRSLNRK